MIVLSDTITDKIKELLEIVKYGAKPTDDEQQYADELIDYLTILQMKK